MRQSSLRWCGWFFYFINTVVDEPKNTYNKFVIDFLASIGLEYKLFNKFYFGLDLEGLYGLNKFYKSWSVNDNTIKVDIDSRILSLGISAGFRFKFWDNCHAANKGQNSCGLQEVADGIAPLDSHVLRTEIDTQSRPCFGLGRYGQVLEVKYEIKSN